MSEGARAAQGTPLGDRKDALAAVDGGRVAEREMNQAVLWQGDVGLVGFALEFGEHPNNGRQPTRRREKSRCACLRGCGLARPLRCSAPRSSGDSARDSKGL